MDNPLARKRKLEPINPGRDNTIEDIESRLRGAMHPGETILSKNTHQDFRPQAGLQSNQYKTSVPLHLNIASDDTLNPDSQEYKPPYESLIFDPLTRDTAKHTTFIESNKNSGLKTGKFLEMQKKNLTFEEKKEEYIPLSLIDREKEIYKKLQLWALRLHKLFLVFQGFLAGVALLHIYLLFFSTDNKTFLNGYCQLARIIGMIFHILIFFALVGSIVRAINEKKHYLHKQMNEFNYDTDLHRLPYYIAVFCVVCYAIAYGLTTAAAMFDNEMHFKYADSKVWTDDSGDLSDFKPKLTAWSVICVVRDILVIIAWIVFCTQSHWNVGSIFIFKIESLGEEERDMNTTEDDEDYKHLFFGNPYLPYGVYQVVLKDNKSEKKNIES